MSRYPPNSFRPRGGPVRAPYGILTREDIRGPGRNMAQRLDELEMELRDATRTVMGLVDRVESLLSRVADLEGVVDSAPLPPPPGPAPLPPPPPMAGVPPPPASGWGTPYCPCVPRCDRNDPCMVCRNYIAVPPAEDCCSSSSESCDCDGSEEESVSCQHGGCCEAEMEERIMQRLLRAMEEKECCEESEECPLPSPCEDESYSCDSESSSDMPIPPVESDYCPPSGV